MDALMLGTLLGGVGLLLLGMMAMTEGLREAAGDGLRRVLERATGHPLKGVLTGALLTGAVQSSSATTVATLGFVNAGLLTLGQAVPVIYGANIGTTVTSWLVALVGFQLNIKAFALPLIGIGMLLRTFAGARRAGAIGFAIVGFGLFFFGVDLLRVGFGDLGHTLPLQDWLRPGLGGVMIAVLLGAVLTTLMQSSSAALTVILTLAAGNLVPLPAAAAMVIGANIGTTTTAIISTIGATPSARRAALAHLAFNFGTGLVALLLLPLLIPLLMHLAADESGTGAGGTVAVLALFHTTFNVLGVVLFLPLTRPLVRWLESLFHTDEERQARPQHLDQTLLATPALARQALSAELGRAVMQGRRLLRAALGGYGELGDLQRGREGLMLLSGRIADYVQQILAMPLNESMAEMVPRALRSLRDLDDALDEMLALREIASAPAMPAAEQTSWMALLATADELLVAESVPVEERDVWAQRCAETKEALLRRTSAPYEIRRLMMALEHLRRLERAVDLVLRAHLHALAVAAAGSNPAVDAGVIVADGSADTGAAVTP